MFNYDYKYPTYIPEVLDPQLIFNNFNLDNGKLFIESSNLNDFYSEENKIEIPRRLASFEKIK